MNWPAGETAFVTGAASGVGLGMARALAAAGAKVALADVDEERLAAAAKELTEAGGTVLAVPLDVTDAAAWPAAADRVEAELGPVSILINNAGTSGGGGPIDQMPLEVWRWVYRINIEAQFIGVSTFLPRFKGRGGRAHITNTASMAGLVPIASVGAYCSSKSASVGFTTVLRDELQGTDIGVSMLCPGAMNTRIGITSEEGLAGVLGQEVNARAAEANTALLATGADPVLVGEQVLEAMRQRQFLIVTHREWLPLVSRVHDEVRGALTEFDGRYGPDVSAQMMAAGRDPVAH